MVERVSFSDQEQTLVDIANHHADVKVSLFEFFAGNSLALAQRYAGQKVDEARDRALAELDLTSSLSVLASIEAALRLDYLRRAYGRWRDPLSRAMKALHDEKQNHAKLDDDLIRVWREETSVKRLLLAEMVAAFNYRHWLAHGRYWTPKLGRRYDFDTVYEIAEEFTDAIEAYDGQ